MANTIWLKQTSDKPLFPDILWGRPENKQSAGRLLIVGGNLHAFSIVASAYSEATLAGIGVARAILPDSLVKSISRIFTEALFAPSTPSGSFSRQALGEVMQELGWADGLLLAGNFGKNSETAIFIEGLLEKNQSLACIVDDGIDYFYNKPTSITNREKTIIVASFSQLQKLAHGQALFKHDMDLSHFVEELGTYTTNLKSIIVTSFADNIIVASSGRVCTTKMEISLVKLATRAVVFGLQNPTKIFEAVTSCMVSDLA